MSPKITEIITILDERSRLYERALALGSSIPTLDIEGINEALDERQRIMYITERLSKQQNELEHALALEPITAAEMGFLREQKARIRDFSPRFLEQEHRVNSILRTRMNAIRMKMATHNRSSSAILSYLRAPGAKPFV